ncbi:MAG: Nif3-like dinuclear metal center hexameric protein [Ruminococcus sp.]|jgi:dinuclear metal center YbgI/SA1388 family protein
MKCSEIMEGLKKQWPETCALDWDNVGLLVGRKEREVEKVFLCLDVTEETLFQALEWGADMVISHHPMIFSAVKKITDQDFLGRKILKLAAGDVAYYAMHTNFDVMGMAALNGESLGLKNSQVLEVTYEEGERTEGIGRVGQLPRQMTLGELAAYVKEQMKIPSVQVYGDLERKVFRAAVSGGSGKSMVKHALALNAEVLVTGDIDYHCGIDAVASGLSIIDAGHYGTEYIFISYMKEKLHEMFPELEIKGAEIHFPFQTV